MGDTSQVGALQGIFLVFYAIFWGGIFNVQARWKAFHWPLFGHFGQARRRALISLLILNLVPIGFFAIAMWALRKPIPPNISFWMFVVDYVRPVVAAFAIFGFYRIWLGIVESWPGCFYASAIGTIPLKYQHVEPTFRHSWGDRHGPVVDLADGAGCPNVFFGCLYVLIGVGALFLA